MNFKKSWDGLSLAIKFAYVLSLEIILVHGLVKFDLAVSSTFNCLKIFCNLCISILTILQKECMLHTLKEMTYPLYTTSNIKMVEFLK